MSYSRTEKLRLILGDDYEIPSPPKVPYSHDSVDSDRARHPTIDCHTTVTRLRSEKNSPSSLDLPKTSTRASPEANSALLTEQTQPAEEEPLRYPLSDLTQAIKAYDPNSRPLIGTLAEPGESFCPIIAISKFHYKHVRKGQRKERIADGFFNGGKFWRRPWNLYYVWPTHSASVKPLLVVPALQVFSLIEDINNNVKDARLSLSTVSNQVGLVLTFNCDHPRLRPRRLGLSTSQSEFKDLELRVPSYTFRPQSEPDFISGPNSEDLITFKRMLDDAANQCKAKASNRAYNLEQRAIQEQNWRNELKQAECFLGLRPTSVRGITLTSKQVFVAIALLIASVETAPTEKTNETWEEIQERQAAKMHARNIPPIVTNVCPPFPFKSNVVFVCLDLECWERDNRVVTEIGVSSLDTHDIDNVPPGDFGKGWYSKINSRHFRIREKSHLCNSDFVTGCPDDFRFGKSEFICEADAAQVMESCFLSPFSGTDLDQRTVVIVGHDIGNDLRSLSHMGFHAKEMKNLHARQPIIDTQSLWRAFMDKQDPQSLGNVLIHFDIMPAALHNAGNDAAYTMQAFLAIVVCSASVRGSKYTQMPMLKGSQEHSDTCR